MTETNHATTERKRKKTRSPNFPAINLETAIERLARLYNAEGRHAAPLESVAAAMDYNTKSSSFLQTLGALNAFGLIETEGKGDERQIKLSQRGFDIVIDENEETQERLDAIKAAALAPAIHKVVWDEYGTELPSDNTIKLFLVKDHGFNPKSAPAFIESYKATIALANLDAESTIDEEINDDIEDEIREVTIRAGMHVQWTSQGVDQFSRPHRVTGISDDGAWAFVEGTKTGVPVAELTVKPDPAGSKQMTNPPSNPHFQSPPPGGAVPISVVMGKGTAEVINIPKMTAKAFEFFKTQLDAFSEAIVIEPESEPKE